MMRLHLQPESARRQGVPLVADMRLNLWWRDLMVKGVSVMHDHPWHFDSLVVSGVLENVRYLKDPMGLEYEHASLKPGPKGGLMHKLGLVKLKAMPPERYAAGQQYRQRADEIHVSRPSDGCVTLNLRERVGQDVARVFWPKGEEWVSAEPRQATPREVRETAEMALARWMP